MIELSQKAATGHAHGKLILIGEHAVVYGSPAIAIPFPSIEVVSTIEEIPESIMIDCEYYHGPLAMVPEKMAGIAACIKETLKVLNRPPRGLLIHLRSTIPLGRGLGSSAAIAIAIVRSLFTFFGQAVQQKELMSIVQIAEKFAHGNPSGIDMVTASSEFPIWFQKGNEVQSLKIGAPLFLVVADSGRIGDTRTAVNSVREKYNINPIKIQACLDRLEAMSLVVRDALLKGEIKILGRLLDLAHEELMALGVSDEGLNRLVVAARRAGALGAKLTGGGLGGCVIALAQSYGHANLLADTLNKAGASKTWNFTIGK